MASLLAEVPAFAHLPPPLLQELDQRLKERRFGAGTLIFREGERGDRLYLILEGSVEVHAKGPSGVIVLATLAEGDLFGEIALLTPDAKRTASIKTVTPLRTLSLEASDFRSLLDSYPEARRELEKAADRLITLNFLKLASPFSSLSSSALDRLASRVKHVTMAKDDLVMRQGEKGETCFLIRSGEAVVFRQEGSSEVTMATLGPGSLFGEAALLTDSVRNASVRISTPSELLVLQRPDLLAAVGSDPEMGHRLYEILSLRDRPKRRPGILAELRQTVDGSLMTILKDPARGAYYRLSPEGWFLWQQLDGKRNLRDLTLSYFGAFKTFAPHTIADSIARLVTAGFLESRTTRALPLLLAPPSAWQRLVASLQKILAWKVVIRNVDPFLTHAYRWGFRWLYTPPAQFLMAGTTVTGIVAFFLQVRDYPSLLGHLWSGKGLSLLIPFLVVAIFFHEAGHAFTTKFFRREVLSIGYGWHWIGPICYVDTSDMWLADRWQRVVVSLAGSYANLFVAGLASLLSWIILDPSISAALLGFALFSYGTVFVNLLPFLEYDGHYALEDLRRSKVGGSAQ